ncbi:hypothetical protein ANCDUO_07304 [Ancylostoma duodenale]|uniref:Uncharacterized protein n=1 Tax=Ancylostoma duodenale TaxID=51022 RepID=A0A0C2DIV4_9BILA|nr:hypothetical protein ANCDUO_07304 [Ancylostoma duodenale]
MICGYDVHNKYYPFVPYETVVSQFLPTTCPLQQPITMDVAERLKEGKAIGLGENRARLLEFRY